MVFNESLCYSVFLIHLQFHKLTKPETKNFGMFFATASLLVWFLKQRQLHLLLGKILFLLLSCHFHLICWSLTYVWSIWFWFICLLSIYFSLMFYVAEVLKLLQRIIYFVTQNRRQKISYIFFTTWSLDELTLYVYMRSLSLTQMLV